MKHSSGNVVIKNQTHPSISTVDDLPDSPFIQNIAFTMAKTEKRKDRMDALMNQMLLLLETRWINDSGIAPEKSWPSTRQLAEYCQLDIYQARHLLLKLVEAGYIQVTPGTKGSTLRWHLSLNYQKVLINRRMLSDDKNNLE
ncbi:FaeA/PapI family transcriptional regulator [Serratia fonticola]|uniref:FaeA/PapI family transcriptional regulator n=1 Tax=Serratia fonticola TaxID=47917 RepID=UPI001376B86B|nr:FaeA/PapI family transcriptional regulator [Serratia fonticola]NBJ34219.1 hypothetical protein [Serratia fonticola]